MCNFRPFNAHIQIFSYVFLNFSQQILSFTKIHTGNRRAVRLTPGCPVITMRSPYLIRYEVLNVITMRIPYLIRYEVLCHCERSVAISRKGNLVIKPPARYFCTCGEKKAQCATCGRVSAFCFPLSHQLLLFFTQLSI